MPRMHLFIWKLIHRALPLMKILSDRTGTGDPLCATYGYASEDVMHLLFGCAFSRACCMDSRFAGY